MSLALTALVDWIECYPYYIFTPIVVASTTVKFAFTALAEVLKLIDN